MAKQGRGLSHYGLQSYTITQPKYGYKVEYNGIELLCPYSKIWVPYSKQKMMPMLLARNNNLSGLKDEEKEEREKMQEEWVSMQMQNLKEKLELLVGDSLMKLWPYFASEEA